MIELTNIYHKIIGSHYEQGKEKTDDIFYEVGLMEDAILDGEQALNNASDEIQELKDANTELESLLHDAERDIEHLEDKLYDVK